MTIKHIKKKKKTLQRQISSISARYDKHDIGRDVDLFINSIIYSVSRMKFYKGNTFFEEKNTRNFIIG